MAHYTGADAKAALITLLSGALVTASEPDVEVVYGSPWIRRDLADDIIAVQDIATVRDRLRIGTNRMADEDHEIRVTISVARANSIDQQACTERAVYLLDILDTALRNVAGENISAGAGAVGVWFGAIVGQIDLIETSADDVAMNTAGRDARLSFAVTARSRRT